MKFLIDVGMAVYLAKHNVETEMKEELRKRLEAVKFANCTAEVINDVVFLYDEDSNFLAQGKTPEEIKDHLRARFKQYHINLAIDTDKCPSWLRTGFTENGTANN